MDVAGYADSDGYTNEDVEREFAYFYRDYVIDSFNDDKPLDQFVCEQLVADYTRKGFIDGRAARLMTVSVRPGRPNGAASGFLSGMFREPLAGQPSNCPVDLDTEVALASPANTLAGILAVAEASRELFGGRTALRLTGRQRRRSYR